MKLAPFAVGCLLFSNTASFGLDLLGALLWYMAAVLGGLALHMFGVYSASVALLSRISPVEFFRRTKTVMLTAFATSSSNATLPTSLRVATKYMRAAREHFAAKGVHVDLIKLYGSMELAPLVGLAVPEDFVLPEGYVRHYQATDDGQRIEAILMFAPDVQLLDEHGWAIAMPEDRIVPPELLPQVQRELRHALPLL